MQKWNLLIISGSGGGFPQLLKYTVQTTELFFFFAFCFFYIHFSLNKLGNVSRQVNIKYFKLGSDMQSCGCNNFGVRQVHVVIKTDGNRGGVPLDPPIFILWVLTPCDTIFTFSLVVNINNFHFGFTKVNQCEFLNCQYNIVNQEPVLKTSLTIWPFLSLQLSILQFQVRDVTLSCHILPQHYLKTWWHSLLMLPLHWEFVKTVLQLFLDHERGLAKITK